MAIGPFDPLSILRRFEAKNEVTVYHGTNASLLPKIRSEGLISRQGYSSGQWFMVAEDIESAAYHATYTDESNVQNPIVIEFRVPTEPKKLDDGRERNMWPGFPYLWKPQPMTWQGNSTKWYALRQPLPPSFIKRTHKV